MDDWLRPDPVKVKEIVNFSTPSNKKLLMTLLGKIKYLRRFIPNMSRHAAPLYSLTKPTAKWKWTKQHDEALKTLKKLISSAPELTVKKDGSSFVFQINSSVNGVCCTFLQTGDQKPIGYASRSLTETEKSYSALEMELLAVLFTCTNYHSYLNGKIIQFTIQTTNKELKELFEKDPEETPIRIRRMLRKLLCRYNFVVEHVSKESMIAP